MKSDIIHARNGTLLECGRHHSSMQVSHVKVITSCNYCYIV